MAEPVSFDDYRLAGNGDSHFDLVHPDGSTFKVAKSGLDNSTIDSIAGMRPVKPADATQKEEFSLAHSIGKGVKSFVDEGKSILHGIVNPLNDPNMDHPAENLAHSIHNFSNGLTGKPTDQPPLLASNVPVGVPGMEAPAGGPVDLGSTIAAPQAVQPVAPVATAPKVPGDVAQAFALQAQGIKDQQKAAELASNAQVTAYDQQAKRAAEIDAKVNAQREVYNKENDKLTQEYMNGDIKPKTVWAGDTGNKVLAAVALALGGIGGGLTGKGGNAALDVINKIIENDLTAQKANLDKKQTLLGNNLQKMRSLDEAELRARSQLTAATAAQVAKSIASSGSLMAKSQGEMLLGQLKQQQHTYNAELAKKQILENVGRPGSPAVNPEALPEDVRERLIELPSGEQRLVRNKADVKEITDELATIKPLFSQLDALDKIGKSALTNKGDREKAFAIRSNIAMLLKENQNLKRLGQNVGSGGDKDSVSVLDQFEDPTKFESILNGNTKLPVLKKYLTDKFESTLSAKISNYKAPYRVPEKPFVAQR